MYIWDTASTTAELYSDSVREFYFLLFMKVLKMTGHMENVFVGLSAGDVASIRQLRLRAQVNWLSKVHLDLRFFQLELLRELIVGW